MHTDAPCIAYTNEKPEHENPPVYFLHAAL